MSTSPSPSRRRVGLVGAGYVAGYHARALQALPFVEVVAVADADLDKAREMAARFHIAHACRSLAEMRDLRLEVVHVLTPPSSHAALAIEALEMGCHVIVEKPMAETAADCDRMMAVAREHGLTLSVNHSARLDPVILEALERIRRGECGEVLAVDFLRSSDYPPYLGGPYPAAYRKGSYPFQDLGVHGLYLLESFLGPIARLETDFRSTGKDINLILDEWRATAECERGVGRLYISWNVRPIQNMLIIQGTRGVMTVDCFLQVCSVRRAYPGPKPAQWILGAIASSLKIMFGSTFNVLRFATGRLKSSPGIYAGAQQFEEAIEKGTAPPVPAEEGRRMVALLEEVSKRADAEVDARRRLPEPPPARVLITGAGGWLGGRLLAKLVENGESVRALARRPLTAGCAAGVHTVIGDLGHPDVVDMAVRGVEVVYHVGAAMKGGAADFERGTVVGTRNIVEACLRHGVKKLVFVSSLSVFNHAGRRATDVVTEDSPYEPYPELRGAYTQTKLEAERLVLDAVRERGLPAVIVRPGQIYGPGAERTPPSGTIGIAGQWLVVGNGRRMVPLVYIDDVVDALLAAATRPDAYGGVFNLVDPGSVDQRAYIQASGHKAHYLPVWFMMLASFGVEMLGRVLKRGVPLSRYRVRSIRPLWPVDVSRAGNGLGWRPRVGVQEGLRRTFPGKG